MRKLIFLTILLYGLSLGAIGAPKMVLLSYDHKWIPGWSPHTFAYFYHEANEESFSISWLPATGPGDVSILGDAVEGKNYSLEETLAFAEKENMRLYVRGPFIIKDELYKKAMAHKERLQSGGARYKVLFLERHQKVPTLHCVYAISDIIKSPALMDNGWDHTVDSMDNVLKHFKKYIVKEEPQRPTPIASLKTKFAGKVEFL